MLGVAYRVDLSLKVSLGEIAKLLFLANHVSRTKLTALCSSASLTKGYAEYPGCPASSEGLMSSYLLSVPCRLCNFQIVLMHCRLDRLVRHSE